MTMSNYPAWESVGDLTAEDVFDSRDAQAWLDWWDDEMIAEEDAANDQSTDLADLRTALRELRGECEGYGWEHGIGFIRESYWVDYCRGLADDIGAVDKSARWPMSFINWDAAADALTVDYDETEIDGTTYYWSEA